MRCVTLKWHLQPDNNMKSISIYAMDAYYL